MELPDLTFRICECGHVVFRHIAFEKECADPTCYCPAFAEKNEDVQPQERGDVA